jgi:hypothetical protein
MFCAMLASVTAEDTIVKLENVQLLRDFLLKKQKL